MYAPRGIAHKGGPLLFRTRQQLVFQSHDIDERLHRLEIGEFHPAMPYPFGQRAVAHCLFDDARQSIARTDLMLFQPGEHERSAHARFHRMEIAELAATDLVHPYPFPGGGRKLGNRKSTRLNSSHSQISYAVFFLTKK